jgi:hypothetical protein
MSYKGVVMEFQSENEKLVHQLTGKTFKDVEHIMERMKIRTQKINEHQNMIRDIFNVRWPAALESENEDGWGFVCSGIDDIVVYLESNSRYFPNYETHVEQWSILKTVANCVCCSYTKRCDNTCEEKRKISQVE